MFHLKLGEVDYVVVSRSEVAREILKTHDVAFASRSTASASASPPTARQVLSSKRVKSFASLRQLCSVELLSSKRVKSFASLRHEEGCKLVSRIRAGAAASTAEELVDLTEVFLGLTNNHLTRAAFGKECGSRERFLRAMKETIKLAPVLSLVDLYPSLASLISRVSGSTRKMKMLHREMDAILDEIIFEHRQKRGGDNLDEDLVDVLLRVQENGELEIPLQMVHIKWEGGDGAREVGGGGEAQLLRRKPALLLCFFFGEELLFENLKRIS